MYSDQPTIPSSVVILRNELTRQPASQCRSSTLTIFTRLSLNLQLRDACPSAVLVLLRGAAADATGALDDTVADDRNRALAHDHVPARRRGNAARRGLVGPFGQFATRPAKRCRGDRLALAAVSARPDRIVHTLESNQAAAAVAHRRTDLDIELLRLGQRAPNDAIGFIQRHTHWFSPPQKVSHLVIAGLSEYEKPRSPAALDDPEIGAGEGIRTPDPNLGKVVLYP